MSRQSVTMRDAQALGTDFEGLMVVISGDETAIERFEEISREVAKRLRGKDAERVYELLRKEEEEAAEGVGFLFG